MSIIEEQWMSRQHQRHMLTRVADSTTEINTIYQLQIEGLRNHPVFVIIY